MYFMFNSAWPKVSDQWSGRGSELRAVCLWLLQAWESLHRQVYFCVSFIDQTHPHATLHIGLSDRNDLRFSLFGSEHQLDALSAHKSAHQLHRSETSCTGWKQSDLGQSGLHLSTYGSVMALVPVRWTCGRNVGTRRSNTHCYLGQHKASCHWFIYNLLISFHALRRFCESSVL